MSGLTHEPSTAQPASASTTPSTARQIAVERRRLLDRWSQWSDLPMLFLGVAWLALVVMELLGRLSRPLEITSYVIWVIFGIDFLIRWIIAPHKRTYLRRNWLTLLALVLPALRILTIFRMLRVLRLAQTARGLRLLRLVTSLNRGMRSLSVTFGRRGLGYVLMLTVLVLLVGSAAMYAFELPYGGFASYREALWWTAMLLVNIGIEYWPQSTEGRLLSVFMSLFALAILGYVTASLASFFIDRDADDRHTRLAEKRDIETLRAEVTALREEIKNLR